MKTYFLLLLMSVYFCHSRQLEAKPRNNEYIPAEYVVIAQKIRADMAKKLSKRHNMEVIGVTGGLAGRVNVLGLSFEIIGPLTKEQLREILIDCVEEFMTAINANERLRPHLKNYPFTPKEIEIELYIKGEKRRDLFDPEIRVAVATHGSLRYHTTAKDNPFGYKSEFMEDYEEALKIVKGQEK
jgi:hypothetical protein